MKKRSIYISIPMTGKDEAQQRRKADYWTRHFEALGYEVINPFDIGDQLKKMFLYQTQKEPTYADYLSEDLLHLESCTDILLCEGWTESFGCMAEVDVAVKEGIQCHFENKIKLN